MIRPIDLDQQSPVKIDRWIEIGSEEWRMLDETPDFTKKCLKFGLEDGFLFFDLDGRIWGKPSEEGKPFYPFHFEVGNRLYGYRMAKKAAN